MESPFLTFFEPSLVAFPLMVAAKRSPPPSVMTLASTASRLPAVGEASPSSMSLSMVVPLETVCFAPLTVMSKVGGFKTKNTPMPMAMMSTAITPMATGPGRFERRSV